MKPNCVYQYNFRPFCGIVYFSILYLCHVSILTIVGWITCEVGTAGWLGVHHIVPISYFYTLVNVFVGYYIRKTDADTQKHSFFYLVHGVGGHFAIVWALFLEMFSIHVQHAFIPCITGYVVGASTLIYYAVHVVMSFNRFWLNRLVSGETKREYTLTLFILITQTAKRRSTWNIEYPVNAAQNVLEVIIILSVIYLTSGIRYNSVISDYHCV